MADLAALWLATLMLSLLSAFHVLSDDVSWPGCTTDYRLVERGNLDNNATGLWLSECNITAITSDDLKVYPNLEFIDLENNKISRIEAGTFDSVSSLRRLDLEENMFLGRDLSSNLFKNCRHLRYLDFRGNDMSETPVELLQGLDLEGLNLSNCSLRSVPPFVTRHEFPNMPSLYLGDNLITKLDPESFLGFVNVKLLDLAGNQIDYLHKDLWKPLTQLGFVDLSRNKLKVVPEELFQNKSSLRTINLSYNLIEYLSVATFLGTDLQTLLIKSNRFTYLPVDFCAGLRSIGVSLERFIFNNNPWRCGCLNELLVEAKTLHIDYRYNYKGRRPECFMTDSFKCHRNESLSH